MSLHACGDAGGAFVFSLHHVVLVLGAQGTLCPLCRGAGGGCCIGFVRGFRGGFDSDGVAGNRGGDGHAVIGQRSYGTSALTVISAAEIRKSGVETVFEAIRKLGGFVGKARFVQWWQRHH